MLIKIFNSKGIEQVELSPNDNSTLIEEIQGDSILSLSFTHFDYLELDVDFYTDFEGKRYWLTEKYRPKQNNRKEWVYNVKMYGVESLLKRLLVIKTVDNEEDPLFTLTAPPREHVALIVGCMNRGMGNVSDWKVGQVDGLENIVVDYFGKYCDEALKEIADKVGAEWWVDGQTVNICKCEYGEPVKLGYGMGLLSIDPGIADNVKFYTRLYPLGSTRNIDREHYGYTRLQLPDGKKYVEINADKYGRVDHYEQEAFSGIYPRRVGTVSNVRSEERIGEEGNPFTIYYFTDDSLPFDPNDYLLPEKVIRVSFQEGSELGGLGNEDNGTYYFEVNYDSDKKEFEIITIWPYGNDMQLPGDLLVPKPGDRYILWNLRMPEEYYSLAEQEFLDAVKRYNEDHALDVTVYKAPTDHVWLEKNKIVLSVGRRIRLESEEYFPSIGYRDSRITRITRKVNLPSSMDIEISDALSRTSQQKISEEITDARTYAESIGKSVALPDIIRTGDRTQPTDNNLFSALRIESNYLNKRRDEKTDHSLSIGGHLTDTKFRQGLVGGEGWGIFKDENGKSVGEFDIVNVRGELVVNSLTVNQIKAIGGMNLYSIANMEVIKVEKITNGYRCYFELKEDYIANLFEVDDIAYCHRFTPGNTSLTFYKRKVTAIGKDYIDVSDESQFKYGSGIPEVGDVIAQYGNYTNKNRQFVVILDVQGGGYIRFLGGLDSVTADGYEYGYIGYQSNDKERFLVGRKDINQYIEFINNKLYIPGTVILGNPSEGGKSMSDTILEAGKEAAKAQMQAFENDYKEKLEVIQTQVDGKAQTWHQNTDPSVFWITEEEKKEHIGDLWYNSNNGTTWYWNGFSWKYQDIPQSVFDTIDGKADIFVTQPNGYNENDLWFLNLESLKVSDGTWPKGTLLVAIKGRESGFSADDWAKKDRYTDDTEAIKAQQEIAGYKYLKEALTNGRTELSGGLMLTSLIELGLWDGNKLTAYSGISGVYTKPTDIAAWYGGDMLDKKYPPSLLPSNPRYAQSLFRFDGSGYLAGNNIGWEADGSGWLAGKNITWDASGAMTFGQGIKINIDGTDKGLAETLGSLATLVNNMSNYLVPVRRDGSTTTWGASDMFAVKSVKGFYSEDFVSAKGLNPDAGTTTPGKSYLCDLLDVSLPSNNSGVPTGSALVFNGTKWTWGNAGLNASQLEGYATQDWAKQNFVSALGVSGNYLTWTKNGVVSNITVPYATLAASSYSLRQYDEVGVSAYPTVLEAKNRLAELIANMGYGIGFPIRISASLVNQWNTDSAALVNGSVYSMFKIGGGYSGSTYGQWMLSSYNITKVGIVGRNQDVWSSIKWLAFTDDISWANLLNKPTTISGYGITDAKIVNGTITLGGTSITPLTSHQSLDYINVKDIRGTNPLPNEQEQFKVTAWFNNTGMPDSNWYSLINVCGWNNTYVSWQLAATSTTRINDKNLYFRVGVGSTWDDWQTVLTSANYATKLDTRYLQISDFEKLFKKVTLPNGETAIEAQYGFYSVDFVSAKGLNNSGSSATEGKSYLSELLDVKPISPQPNQYLMWNGTKWTASNIQQGLDESALGNYLTKNNYVTSSALGNYVTIDTAQTITAPKTITKQIIKESSNSSWYTGRDNAMIRINTCTGYTPIWSVKTETGSWECGSYIDENLYFNLIGDQDYNSKNNGVKAQIRFTPSAQIRANAFIKSGGTSSQFLKADGSVDSNAYVTTSSLGNYLPLSGGTMSNTNLVTNLNADLLDGYHADSLKGLRTLYPNLTTTESGTIIPSILGPVNGYPLFTDPDFAIGNNSVNVYNNGSANGTVTITRIADNQQSANSSGYILQITSYGSPSPGCGGFYQGMKARANAIFLQIFRAKIPVGYSVTKAENSMGSGYSTTWLTDTAGTGKWEWYARLTICGNSEPFSSGGHVYLLGPQGTSSSPLIWYLASCNCYDLTYSNYNGGLRSRLADSADSASKLSDNTAYTAWGQTYFQNGVPKTISGNMTGVGWIYGSTTSAPYLRMASSVPIDAGSLGTAIGFGSAPDNFGTFIWGEGSGNGHIQVGRKDGTNKAYNLCLQEFGGNVIIGATSSSYKLHVNGTLYASGATTLASTLTVSGLITANGGITIPTAKTLKIGECEITWDTEKGGLKFSKGIYSTDWVSAMGANNNAGETGGKNNLSDLLDVEVTSKSPRQYLMWNGSKWVASSVSWDDIANKPNVTADAVTDLGVNGNYVTWTKNGTVNNLTVPFASNADTVDGYHASSFASRAIYNTKGGNTGYYKIRITPTTSWMLYFRVRIYQNYQYYDIDFSGYNYGVNHWYQPKARLVSSDQANIKVYFGYDSDWNLWVAVPASSYTGISIVDVVNGYTTVDDYKGLFVIENVASLTGTTQTELTLSRGASISDLTWANIQNKPTTLSGYGITDALSATTANASFVTALGTSGNSLTWTKNGTTNNITIPYATNAGNASALGSYGESRFFRDTIASLDPSGFPGNLPGNRSGSYIVTSAGWYGSAHVLYCQGSNSGMAFYRPGGSNSVPQLLCAIDSSSNWTNYGTILTTGQGNAVSATRLQGTYSLWGQTFYGNNVSGNISNVGNIGTDTAPAGMIYANDWFRSMGDTGWYSYSYGGGVYMEDFTWVRIYNSKSFYCSSTIRADGELHVGSLGARFIVNTGGNVGIGVTNPIYKLHVQGNVGVGGEIYATTGIWSDGYISCRGKNDSSDINLKKDFKPLNLSLAEIAFAPSYTFKWIDNNDDDFGSIAQYWQKVNPLFVRKDPKGNLTMPYGKIALTAVVSLAKKTNDHEVRIQALERDNVKLKEENKELKRQIEKLQRA